MDKGYIQNLIRDYPDFPKPGILFRDLTPIFRDGKTLNFLGEYFYEHYKSNNIGHIVGIEARGFIFSTILGLKFNLGIVMIRKAGKLPGDIIKQKYDIEYGTAIMELQSDAIKKDETVLIADDLLATGGTALAAAKLIEDLGGKVYGFAFIVELSSLGGRKILEEKGYVVHSLVIY
ncbi:MAG TPA: adenine phosphoribosyltransferase [Candidatus Nitrosocosmicus sp.]